MQSRLSLFCDRLLEAGWLGAAAGVPLFFNIYSNRIFEPDKLTLLRLLAVVMAATWLVKVVETSPGFWSLRPRLKTAIKSNPLAIPVLGFIIVYGIATVASVAPTSSLWGSYHRHQGTITFLAYMVIFFIAAHHLRYKEQWQRLVMVTVLTSIPISLYGILQHLGRDPIPWSGDVTERITSTMGNAIFMGAYLIMVIPLTMTALVLTANSLVSARGRAAKVGKLLAVSGYLVILLIQLVALLFTQSRGPWMAMGIGMTVLLVFLPLIFRRPALSGAFGGASLAALIFIFFLNTQTSFLTPLKSISPYINRLGTFMDFQSGTNKVRLLIWFGDDVGGGAWQMATHDPIRFVIGHGPESMFVAYNPFYPPDLAHYEARNAVPDRSHNDFFDQLVTTGILGLGNHLIILGVFFVLGFRVMSGERELYRRLAALAMMAAVVAHLAETSFGIAIAATRALYWIYLAAMVALPGLTAAEKEPVPAPVLSTRRSQRRRLQKKPSSFSWAFLWRRWRLYPILAYLSVVALSVPSVFGRGMAQRVQQDPAFIAWAGFAVLVLGILLTAFALNVPNNVKLRLKSSGGWLYLLVIPPVIYLAHLFLSPVIADIYFKIGQEYERVQRYDLSLPGYLKAASWGDYQDVYYSFLGGSYLRLTEKTKEVGPTLSIKTVADLYSPGFSQPWQTSRDDLIQAALVAFVRARDLNPLNPDNTTNLGRLYTFWGQGTSDPEQRSQRFAEAHRYYDESVKLRPNAAHIYAEGGWAFFLDGKQKEAEDMLRRALTLDDRYEQTYAYLGELMRAQKRNEEAIDIFVRGGRAFTAVERWNEAQSMFGSAIQLDASRVEAYRGLASLFKAQKKWPEALEVGTRVVQLLPQDATAHREVAFFHQQLGHRNEAISEAEKALELASPEQKNDYSRFLAQLQGTKG
ncbi:MAG: O-antigen ligase family protein [Chloroflexi bacterium]|nr:O-antigen ligase family protein [Chloroflexota bacterium]